MRHNFRRFIVELAESTDSQQLFRSNPEAYMRRAGLKDDEKAVCRIRDPKEREEKARAMLSDATAHGQIIILFDDGG